MDKLVGRIAMRVQGDWWVAYYAKPGTMDGALELGRVRMAVVADSEERKHAFVAVVQNWVAESVPEFRIAEAQLAPEHERSGRG
jgi:hypothetical protein